MKDIEYESKKHWAIDYDIYCGYSNITAAQVEDGYQILLDTGTCVTVTADDFTLVQNDVLPMWATLWSFGEESVDVYWLEKGAGLQALSECGFRVFYHEEFGYYFGIDGAGYDFFAEHWIPLYLARGLKWHNQE